jgi:uncharacterized membrane protein
MGYWKTFILPYKEIPLQPLFLSWMGCQKNLSSHRYKVFLIVTIQSTLSLLNHLPSQFIIKYSLFHHQWNVKLVVIHFINGQLTIISCVINKLLHQTSFVTSIIKFVSFNPVPFFFFTIIRIGHILFPQTSKFQLDIRS